MTRTEQLLKELSDDIDCAIITSDINRFYFTGMKSSAGVCVIFRDSAYLLIDSRYYEKACDTVKEYNVILMTDYYTQIDELLEKHNAVTVAIETKTMTVSEYQTLCNKLKNRKVMCSGDLSRAVDKMRSLKTLDEIDKIKIAQKIAEKAFENVLNFISEGKTEKEIAFELDSYMLKNGAEAVSFDTIALSGKNTSLPHGVPSDKKVNSGEFVLMDFGAVYEGYHSDMTRTVCVGEPDEEMTVVYNTVLNAQLAALDSLHAGINCSKPDSIARNYISEHGYGSYFGHGLGHSVGLEIHELPSSSPKATGTLDCNVIITIEPGIYLPKKLGVRIEDMAAITETGHENLTKAPKKLIKL